MPDSVYTLGTVEASEQLLRDLYVDLRVKVNRWACLTRQTPQARMGYIGQHLVSVVTGFRGSGTGARGRDLILPEDQYAEIKTCYRVDQLGSCGACGAAVSSVEERCPFCGSDHIQRKEDSKWLIGIRHDEEFSRILEPVCYYFVLFENQGGAADVTVSIWQADPKTKGFAYMLMDYYLNIRSASKSKAPLDLWPYQLKFYLTGPKLIYRAVIRRDNRIETSIFPGNGREYIDELPALPAFEKATTLKKDYLTDLIRQAVPEARTSRKNKRELLTILEDYRTRAGLENAELCDFLASGVYRPRLRAVREQIPSSFLAAYPELDEEAAGTE